MKPNTIVFVSTLIVAQLLALPLPAQETNTLEIIKQLQKVVAAAGICMSDTRTAP